MRMFLTGASGVMGRSSIVAMREAGHEVVALVRGQEAACAVTALGAVPRLGDVFDPDGMVRGMRGCDAVVDLASDEAWGRRSVLPSARRRADLMRSAGAESVAYATRVARVPRLVRHSTSAVYAAGRDDEWIDELGAVEVTRAVEPTLDGEAHVADFTRRGGTGVVLRLGRVTGPDPRSQWWVRRAREGRSVLYGDPTAWAHVVHPDDVGTAVVAALSVPAGTWNVGAEPLRRVELADAHAHAVGRREALVVAPVPQRLAGLRLEWRVRSQRVDSSRFRAVSGWEPQHPKLTPDWFDA